MRRAQNLFSLVVPMALGAAFTACQGHDAIDCEVTEATPARSTTTELVAELKLDSRGQWASQTITRVKRYADRARAQVSSSGTVEIAARGSGSGAAKMTSTDGSELVLSSAFSQIKGAAGTAEAITQDSLLAQFSVTAPLPEMPSRFEQVLWTPQSAEFLAAAASSLATAAPAAQPVDMSAAQVVDLAAEAESFGLPYHTAEGLESPFPIEAMHWSGDPRHRLNLIILGDGYRASEMAKFKSDAQAMVDHLLRSYDNDFYGEYSDLFNIIRVDVPSNESGASCDDGTSHLRDTRYGVTFPVGCSNAIFHRNDNDRFAYPRHLGRMKSDADRVYFDKTTIQDEIVIISNTAKYGGAALPPGATFTLGGSWETAAHELGHSWGDLGDEYTNPGDICNILGGTSANLSLKHTKASNVEWAAWIGEGTPIPTPSGYSTNADLIGLYQGGGGGCTGALYRPSNHCKMISHGNPFCSVCKEQMIRRLYDRASLIAGEITRSGNLLSAPVLRGDKVTSRWYLDDELVQEFDTYQPLDLASLGIAPGSHHEARLVVFDDRAPVRKNRCDLVFSKKISL